jgi:hypothetical protein
MNCQCPVHRTTQPGLPAHWVTLDTAIGPVTRLTLLTDGRVLCQICFDYTWPCGLHEAEPGVLSDICKQCQIHEQHIIDNMFVCPRCGAKSMNPEDKLHQYCNQCHDFTGEVRPHEICEFHKRYEPERDGDYKCCIECGHVWRTEQDFLADVLRARKEHALATLKYEGVELPPDTTDPLSERICPLCTHDF